MYLIDKFVDWSFPQTCLCEAWVIWSFFSWSDVLNKKSNFWIFFRWKQLLYKKFPSRENFHVQLQDIVVDQQPVHFADTASFLEKLKKANKSAVIFSVTDPKPQPKLSGPSLLQVLPRLYNTDNVILSPDELNAKCIQVFKDMTVSDTFFMNNLSMKFEMLIKLKCWKYMFCFQTLRHCLYHAYSC